MGPHVAGNPPWHLGRLEITRVVFSALLAYPTDVRVRHITGYSHRIDREAKRMRSKVS